MKEWTVARVVVEGREGERERECVCEREREREIVNGWMEGGRRGK